jgi:GxxExxY protein
MDEHERPNPAEVNAMAHARRETFDDPVTYGIIGAAQKVHRTLGPGFAESTYQAAMEKELSLRGVAFESQRKFEVQYEGASCGTYIPDLVVSGEIVVELKAADDFAAPHFAQVISYLKASGLRAGLLLNFGTRSLQVRRFRS